MILQDPSLEHYLSRDVILFLNRLELNRKDNEKAAKPIVLAGDQLTMIDIVYPNFNSILSDDLITLSSTKSIDIETVIVSKATNKTFTVDNYKYKQENVGYVSPYKNSNIVFLTNDDIKDRDLYIKFLTQTWNFLCNEAKEMALDILLKTKKLDDVILKINE